MADGSLEHATDRRLAKLRESPRAAGCHRTGSTPTRTAQAHQESRLTVATPTSSRFLREPRIIACTLDAQEHENRHEHRRLDLLEQVPVISSRAAPEIGREHIGLEVKDRQDNEQQQRNDLGDRHDRVDSRRLLHATQHQKIKRPNPDRRECTATIVLPCPSTGRNAPSVDLIRIQYETLPTQALAQ